MYKNTKAVYEYMCSWILFHLDMSMTYLEPDTFNIYGIIYLPIMAKMPILEFWLQKLSWQMPRIEQVPLLWCKHCFASVFLSHFITLYILVSFLCYLHFIYVMLHCRYILKPALWNTCLLINGLVCVWFASSSIIQVVPRVLSLIYINMTHNVANK